MHNIVDLDTLPGPALRKINHNYLPAQFADMEDIWAKIRETVKRGDFTLGKALGEFEEQCADYLKVKHVIGVNSGTDALILILKALGIRGEVIVPAFTFVATLGAVVMAGARPVLVDVGDDFCMDTDKIDAAVTPHTEAIIPVHWAGRPCEMDDIVSAASRHGLKVIEDACHAMGAGIVEPEAVGPKYGSGFCGQFGIAGAFSLHPLKNLNVWGDGGYISTNDDKLAAKLKLWRNHGLETRDKVVHYAHNSRLDTVQAVVASHVLGKLDWIIERRRHNSRLMDEALKGCEGFSAVPIPSHKFMTYYLYTGHARHRDELLAYLNERGVDAKAHYPIPMHLQPAAAYLGYKRGAFPVAEYCADSTISLPVHEYVTDEDVLYMAGLVNKFYASRHRRVA